MREKEIPYYRRRLGVVFQDFRLFPHMTVFENVAFAMRAIGESSREIKKRVPIILRVVNLEGKMKSFPGELSAASSSGGAGARPCQQSPVYHRGRAYRQYRPPSFP